MFRCRALRIGGSKLRRNFTLFEVGFPEDGAAARVICNVAFGGRRGGWCGYELRRRGAYWVCIGAIWRRRRRYTYGIRIYWFEHASVAKVLARLVDGEDEVNLVGTLQHIRDDPTMALTGQLYRECVVQDWLVVLLCNPLPVLHRNPKIFHCETLHDQKSLLDFRPFRGGR